MFATNNLTCVFGWTENEEQANEQEEEFEGEKEMRRRQMERDEHVFHKYRWNSTIFHRSMATTWNRVQVLSNTWLLAMVSIYKDR